MREAWESSNAALISARFPDAARTLDPFDFAFHSRMDKKLAFELASSPFLAKKEDGQFLGPPGTGKSHLAQSIGHAAILHCYEVLYKEAHTLVEQLRDARVMGERKEQLKHVGAVPLLNIEDLGMRNLSHTAAEELLEVIMRRYE